jgi:hypothetical protein
MTTMRARRRLAITITLALFIAAWTILGVGYSRMSKACYESRHSIDPEPEVYGGALGLAIDIAFWPLEQAGNAINGIDCSSARGAHLPSPAAPLNSRAGST